MACICRCQSDELIDRKALEQSLSIADSLYEMKFLYMSIGWSLSIQNLMGINNIYPSEEGMLA